MSNSKDLDSWATFFKSFNRVHDKIEDILKNEGFPDLEVYDVLWTLEQSDNHRLRFNELGEKVFINRCNITRMCERLEKEGLIERTRCPSDRRGVWAELTPAGEKLRKNIWKTYSELIQENFSQKLTAKDHQDLVRILKKVWDQD